MKNLSVILFILIDCLAIIALVKTAIPFGNRLFFRTNTESRITCYPDQISIVFRPQTTYNEAVVAFQRSGLSKNELDPNTFQLTAIVPISEEMYKTEIASNSSSPLSKWWSQMGNKVVSFAPHSDAAGKYYEITFSGLMTKQEITDALAQLKLSPTEIKVENTSLQGLRVPSGTQVEVLEKLTNEPVISSAEKLCVKPE